MHYDLNASSGRDKSTAELCREKMHSHINSFDVLRTRFLYAFWFSLLRFVFSTSSMASPLVAEPSPMSAMVIHDGICELRQTCISGKSGKS